MFRQAIQYSSTAFVTSLLLVACDKSDKPKPDDKVTETYSYQVTIKNLTASQPLSPVALILHSSGYSPFTLGEPASIELEVLAESGANSDFLAEATSNASVLESKTGAGLIVPSSMETIEISATVDMDSIETIQLSLATMLVNTNDAITALSSFDLSQLQYNESITVMLTSYDAGTEANSETADTIPGPAAAGGLQEAFNSSRDDVINAVLAHSGVVTMDDGLPSSILTNLHKWDNPVASLVVKRMQ